MSPCGYIIWTSSFRFFSRDTIPLDVGHCLVDITGVSEYTENNCSPSASALDDAVIDNNSHVLACIIFYVSSLILSFNIFIHPW